MLEDLDGESQIKELAVMLGGPQYTEVSLNSARELMQKAAKWKESQKGKSRG